MLSVSEASGLDMAGTFFDGRDGRRGAGRLRPGTHEASRAEADLRR
ncbi:hypothetical protein GCM10027060_26060 [Nesterenkonia halophila]